MRAAFGGRGRGRPAEHAGILAEEEGDPVETRADPDELPGRAELVEQLRPVRGHAPGQDVALPQPHRQRQGLQRHERLAERRPAVDPVPARQEPAQRRLLGRLDLLPQSRERRPPQPPEHVGIAPLALGPARSQLAANEQLLPFELAEHRLDVDAEPPVRLGGRERAAGTGETGDERAQGLVAALEEDLGQPRRRHRAEPVAVAACVLGGDEAFLSGHSDADRAPLSY